MVYSCSDHMAWFALVEGPCLCLFFWMIIKTFLFSLEYVPVWVRNCIITVNKIKSPVAEVVTNWVMSFFLSARDFTD